MPLQKFSPNPTTLKIIAAAIFNLICYINVGLPLAIIAQFVHQILGFNTIIAGLMVSIAYLSTFLTRPGAGRWMDTKGPKSAVIIGLFISSFGGIFMLIASFFTLSPLIALGFLLFSRFCSGASESWGSTGVNVWNIGRVGIQNAASVISWNGITSYGGMAAGAPLGLYIYKSTYFFGGLPGIAVITTLSGIIFALIAITYPSVAPIYSKTRLPFAKVFMRIFPYGCALGLGSVGFGGIQAFIALYFIANNWQNSATALSLFGICFVSIRLIFPNAIANQGGYRVSIYSFIFETLGLCFLWLGNSIWMAFLGAGLTGCGFSLTYPALGIIAVSKVGPENRGSALASFSLFMDIAICVAGPILGAIQYRWGYNNLFACTALCTFAALILTYILFYKANRHPTA